MPARLYRKTPRRVKNKDRFLKFCHKESGEEVSRVGTPWEGGKGGEKTSKVGSLLEFREYNPLWLSRGEGFSFIRSLSGAV